MRAPGEENSAAGGRVLTSVTLLWLAGNGLRLTILAVPPVIPLIHADLQMSETEIGVLTGLPPLLFACAALPGSFLIARFGALPTLVAGLFATAVGSALRGAAPNVWLLYAATVLTGLGVAVMQPSLPPLVRAWLPHRIGFGTAVYTNGLLVGEILPVALTIPWVLPLLGSSWRLGLAAWAVPVVLIALLVATLAPRDCDGLTTGAVVMRRWWPDWKSRLLWRLGLMLGGAIAMYFTTNAFIPDYLHHIGRGDLISGALTALNTGQLPASALLLLIAGQLERRTWPYLACGAMCIVAVLGITFGSAVAIIGAAALLGFASSSILILVLAQPPLLSPPDDVHRLSAGIFTVSYPCAVIVPILSGLSWDWSGIPALAFAPIGLCALLLLVLAPTNSFNRAATAVGRQRP